MLGDTMGYNYDEQYDTWVWLKVEYAIKESQIAALERKMINYWIWGGHLFRQSRSIRGFTRAIQANYVTQPLKIAIEIVSFPSSSMVILHSYHSYGIVYQRVSSFIKIYSSSMVKKNWCFARSPRGLEGLGRLRSTESSLVDQSGKLIQRGID